MSKFPTGHSLYTQNPGLSTNKADFNSMQWGKESNSSFIIGRSSFPFFFTAEGHNVHLQDTARGLPMMSLFDGSYNPPEDCIKWSFDTFKFNTEYMTFFNIPKNLSKYPKTTKILPMAASYFKENNVLLCHSPFCYYFRRHTSLNYHNFLMEETCWHDGSVFSSVVAAIKLPFVLGFRTVVLNNPPIGEEDYDKLIQIKKQCDKFKLKVYIVGDYKNDIGFEIISQDLANSKCILK